MIIIVSTLNGRRKQKISDFSWSLMGPPLTNSFIIFSISCVVYHYYPPNFPLSVRLSPFPSICGCHFCAKNSTKKEKRSTTVEVIDTKTCNGITLAIGISNSPKSVCRMCGYLMFDTVKTKVEVSF